MFISTLHRFVLADVCSLFSWFPVPFPIVELVEVCCDEAGDFDVVVVGYISVIVAVLSSIVDHVVNELVVVFVVVVVVATVSNNSLSSFFLSLALI